MNLNYQFIIYRDKKMKEEYVFKEEKYNVIGQTL